MKKLKTEVTYKVPSWNFCNMETGTMFTGKVSKETCRFCIKKNGAYRCILHNEPLTYDGAFIDKTEGCCVATAGVGIEILEPAPVAIEPKKIIKMAIDEYTAQVGMLVAQGYPQAMAEKFAKQSLFGG